MISTRNPLSKYHSGLGSIFLEPQKKCEPGPFDSFDFQRTSSHMYKKKSSMRNCLSGFSILVAWALLSCAHAQSGAGAAESNNVNADDAVVFDSDPKSWARVKRIVPPTYPSEALEQGVGGIVDVDVLIGVLGYATKIRSINSTPRNQAFEEATRAVVKSWLFNVPQTSRCVPYETVGNARLTFAVVNGAPEIVLSHRASPVIVPPKQPVGTPRWLNADEVRKSVQYPFRARRSGAQGYVNAMMSVSAENGELLDVEVTHVLAPNAFKQEFSEEVLSALKKAKFEAVPGRKQVLKYCVPFVFRLRD